jgi:hypothetical protein
MRQTREKIYTNRRKLAEKATLQEELEPFFNGRSRHESLDIDVRMRKRQV